MENLLITLTDDQAAFVRSQIPRKGHASATDYVQELILAEQKRLARADFEATLIEALDGPGIPADENFWDSIRREALEGLTPGEIRP